MEAKGFIIVIYGIENVQKNRTLKKKISTIKSIFQAPSAQSSNGIEKKSLSAVIKLNMFDPRVDAIYMCQIKLLDFKSKHTAKYVHPAQLSSQRAKKVKQNVLTHRTKEERASQAS